MPSDFVSIARRITVSLAIVAGASTVPLTAHAAAVSSAPATKCRAETDQNTAVAPKPDSTDQSLTEQLADCSSVLKPPLTGDREIVEPATPVGDTPVIRPDDLPDNQSGSNSKL